MAALRGAVEGLDEARIVLAGAVGRMQDQAAAPAGQQGCYSPSRTDAAEVNCLRPR